MLGTVEKNPRRVFWEGPVYRIGGLLAIDTDWNFFRKSHCLSSTYLVFERITVGNVGIGGFFSVGGRRSIMGFAGTEFAVAKGPADELTGMV